MDFDLSLRNFNAFTWAIDKSEKVLREYSDSRYVQDAKLLKGKSHYFYIVK